MARNRVRNDDGEAVAGGREVDRVMADISKTMGEGVARSGTEMLPLTHVPTGVFILDFALLGGLPEGCVTELYGWEASGKTTLALKTVAAMQRKRPDSVVVWIDCEGTLDKLWAELNGVQLDKLIISEPDTGEQAVDIIEAMLRSREVSMVVLDSIPAMIPSKEVNSSAEDALVAERARLVGRMCSKILAALAAEKRRGHRPVVIFVNQFRIKIGVMFGDNRTTSGGNQPKYISAVRIETKLKKQHTHNTEHGETCSMSEHGFKVIKSKLGGSVREGEYKLITDSEHPLGAGAVDDYLTVTGYAKNFGLITGGGQKWMVEGIDEPFRKRDDIIQYLMDNPQQYERLKRIIIAAKREMVGLEPIPRDGYLLGAV